MATNIKSSEKLEKLLADQEALKEQIASEKAKIAKENRKLDTRLKIQVGAWLIAKHRKDGTLQELYSEMDQVLQKPADRKCLSILSSEIANLKPKDVEPPADENQPLTNINEIPKTT